MNIEGAMKIKISELIPPALDWAVVKANGQDSDYWLKMWMSEGRRVFCVMPSSQWSQGGPIINLIGGFELKIWLESKPSSKCEAHIHNYTGDWIAFGPTPLIAAMRCYVASKLGDEVEIPEDLI